MSLTSYLNYDIELKGRLKKLKFVVPKIDASQIIPSRGNDNRILGAAFDYGFRLFLEKVYKQNTEKYSTNNIAEEALKQLIPKLKNDPKIGLVVIKKDRLPFSYMYRFKSKLVEKRLRSTMKSYRKAKQQFLKLGIVSDSLCKGLLFLANLDVYYRSGKLYDQFDKPDLKLIQELKDLLNLNRSFSYIPRKNIYLNPSFGIASKMIGGADADFIIDDTLFEIKLTKDTKIERKSMYQLIGYYLLSQIQKDIEKTNLRKIKNFAVFFPRSKFVWKIRINEVLPLEKERRLVKWFRRHLEIPYQREQKYLSLRNEFDLDCMKVKSKEELVELFKKFPKFHESIEVSFGFRYFEKSKRLVRIPKFLEERKSYLELIKSRDKKKYKLKLKMMSLY